MVKVVVGADFYGDGVGIVAARMAAGFDLSLRFGKDACGPLIPGVVNVIGDGAELDVPLLISSVGEAVAEGSSPSLLISERALVGGALQVSELYCEDAELSAELETVRELLRPYVGDAGLLLDETLAGGGRVLLVGSGGALSEASVGAFPPGKAAGALTAQGCISAGLPPTAPESVTAVMSAYACVPPGIASVTAHGGEEGERQVGWFDVPAARFGCRIQGATEVALTGLEVLEGQEEVRVCVGYEICGETVERLPAFAKLSHAKPIYATLPGWQGPIQGRDWRELPFSVRFYAEFIEKCLGLPVAAVAVGPAPNDVIFR